MRKAIFVLLVCILSANRAWAVKTAHWIHTTEADFKQGTLTHVVATNLGDLKLSREVKTLLEQDARVSAVFALAQAGDGTIYAGTGPEGVLLAVKDDKVTTAADLGQHTNIFSLLVDSQGRLLIGTGGEKGQILRMEKSGEKPKEIFSSDDVQYIWSMVQTPDGMLYAATGPNGQLVAISPDGTAKVLLDSDENNLLCLLSDGKDSLYVGTDPNGLVLRVNRQTGDLFVVYDAAESEISALARDSKGNLYAATAEAINAPGDENQGGESSGAADQVGRPESDQRSQPIPGQPPANPKPPEVPKPAPGEPLPIPKTIVKPLNMMILADPGDEPGPTTSEAPLVPTGPRPAAGLPGPERPKPSNGNAVYKIDPDGFVTEVFRQQVSVFALLLQPDDTLLVATGSDGGLYQINPAAEETSTITKVDSKEILCLMPAKDGRVFLGLANSGDIAAMGSGFATDGTYVSPVLDAEQISRFGKIQLRGSLPAGSAMHVSTRSGNVEEADAPGWSTWSDEVSASQFVQTNSPPARFLQYRFRFSSDNGKVTPVVEDVDVAYQVPNLPPVIKSIKIGNGENLAAVATTSGDENHTPNSKITISWEATDPNEDDLVFSLSFRRGRSGPWILMKDKLKDPTYDWETRNVGDGRYEIKVEGDDSGANPAGQGKKASRVSDPVIVDNTPPAIGDLKTQVEGTTATIKMTVVDQTSTVARLDYSVDSAEDWQTALPSDSIADSPEEAYEVVIKNLSAGAHQITLRAADAKGNRAYETVNVTVDKPASSR
ncbi:MAG TPA: hypothetical protein VH518_18185 [Tepidisphaeraceae bacterium]|jgi:hypothetical protein